MVAGRSVCLSLAHLAVAMGALASWTSGRSSFSFCMLHVLTDRIASVQSDWNVVKRGYYAHVLGEADNKFTDPVQALKTLKVKS